ncbi:MAG: fimbrillin family protein [Rikenellaceae bacterium]|nr:fimbrillin family protein [Rikenellaceae bacterium]
MFLVLAVASAAAASCSIEKECPQKLPMSLVTRMEAEDSRATTDNNWNGISGNVMVSIDNAAAAPFTVNQATGVLSPVTPLYWTSHTQTISARAWYPASWTMRASQATMADYQAADFIFGPQLSISYSEQSTKPLVFKHKMVKLTVNLIAGSGVSASDLANATVRFYGYNYGTANTSTGTITGSTNGNIIPLKDGNKYTALLIPQTIVAPQWLVKVTIGSTDYLYPDAGSVVLTAGHACGYGLTLSREGMSVTSNIDAWEDDEYRSATIIGS